MKFLNTEMTIFVRIHHPDGHMNLVPCSMSVLTPEDTDEVIRLHDEVSHGLSKEVFAAKSHDEIMRLLSPEGLAVGIKHKGSVISTRAVIIGKQWVKESLDPLGVPTYESESAAFTGYCVVAKEFRGNNVQFLSQYYAENLISQHFKSIYTTVSPYNVFSLENVLNCNYRIVGIVNVYGGLLRYVLKKAFMPKFPLWTHWHLKLPIRDIDAQREALAKGYRGYKIIRKHSGIHILYAYEGDRPNRYNQ